MKISLSEKHVDYLSNGDTKSFFKEFELNSYPSDCEYELRGKMFENDSDKPFDILFKNQIVNHVITNMNIGGDNTVIEFFYKLRVHRVNKIK